MQIYRVVFPKEKTMKRNLISIIILTALVAFAGTAYAEIRVISVKGTASYKAGGGWAPLGAGIVLAPGTKVSTGVRSRVEIRINRHTVTVEPLTIMKINESYEDGKNSTTRIGLRRGSIRTDVARDARIKTVFKVSTPVATSSVRGTRQVITSGPTFGDHFFVPKNSAFGEGLNSGPQLISGNLKFDQKSDRGGSENPIRGMKEELVQAHPLIISADEAEAFGFLGDDFMFYGPEGRGAGGQSKTVPVTIHLIWPAQ